MDDRHREQHDPDYLADPVTVRLIPANAGDGVPTDPNDRSAIDRCELPQPIPPRQMTDATQPDTDAQPPTTAPRRRQARAGLAGHTEGSA